MSRLEQLQHLLGLSGEDPFLLYALAQEYAKLDRHDEAITYYERCVGVDPDYCYAYYHAARSYVELDRADAAVEQLERGLEAARRCKDGKAADEIIAFLAGLRGEEQWREGE